MHIVFITSEFPTPGLTHGGVGSFVKFLATLLVKEGINATVVGFYPNQKRDCVASIENGISVYRLALSKWKFLRFVDHSVRINGILRLINSKSPIDIVETAELGLAFLNKVKGVKFVIRMHGGHHFFAEAERRKTDWWKSFQERRSFMNADALVGVSRYVVTRTAAYLKFNPESVPIIFNVVDTTMFGKADPGKQVSGRIVFVGTVCEKKGIRQLIMAMPEICRNFPDAHLIIVGRDWFFPDGQSYTKYLEQYLDDTVRDKIKFLGPLPNREIPALLESASVCAYPSHMEAMPIAWLEGLAMGKAVVASTEGPGPEVVVDGVTGLLCDPYSPADIARKIELLLTDRELANSLGDNARSDIMNRFDAKRLVKENIDFFQSIA